MRDRRWAVETIISFCTFIPTAPGMPKHGIPPMHKALFGARRNVILFRKPDRAKPTHVQQHIQNIQSISQLHQVFGFGKPTHPLISVVDVSGWEIPEAYVGVKYSPGLYVIGLKDKSCGLQYGRNVYDFDEGVLFFTAPGQVQSVSKPQALNEVQGWMIFFHPDLIRNTSLGERIDHYGFFSYDVHEALHLSYDEQTTITECKRMIERRLRKE